MWNFKPVQGSHVITSHLRAVEKSRFCHFAGPPESPPGGSV